MKKFKKVNKTFGEALENVDSSEVEKIKEGKEIKIKLEKLLDDIKNDREFNELVPGKNNDIFN